MALNLGISGASMTENNNAVEVHGCIVCARLFNILVVYAPDGRLEGCAVTSPGGHRVPDETMTAGRLRYP